MNDIGSKSLIDQQDREKKTLPFRQLRAAQHNLQGRYGYFGLPLLNRSLLKNQFDAIETVSLCECRITPIS